MPQPGCHCLAAALCSFMVRTSSKLAELIVIPLAVNSRKPGKRLLKTQKPSIKWPVAPIPPNSSGDKHRRSTNAKTELFFELYSVA